MSEKPQVYLRSSRWNALPAMIYGTFSENAAEQAGTNSVNIGTV